MSTQYPSNIEEENDKDILHRESGYGTMPDLHTIKEEIQNPSASYKEASIDYEEFENMNDIAYDEYLTKNELLKSKSVDEMSDSFSSPTPPLRKWRPMADDIHLISLDTQEYDNKISGSDDLERDDNFGKLSEFVGKSHSNSSNGTSADSKIETPKPVRMSWFSGSELLYKPFFQKLKDTVTGKQTLSSSIKAPKTGRSFLKRYISDRKRIDKTLNIPIYTDRERFNMQFEVLDQIGSGGNSVVKLAFDKIRNHQVVCKFIQNGNIWHWSPANVPLEIETMQKLKHQNIMILYDYFSLDGGNEWILVLEYLGKDWMDLYDYIETFGPVNEEDTKIIFSHVLDALEFMHKHGYSHNDIKGFLNFLIFRREYHDKYRIKED
jgi:hypothetical protein